MDKAFQAIEEFINTLSLEELIPICDQMKLNFDNITELNAKNSLIMNMKQKNQLLILWIFPKNLLKRLLDQCKLYTDGNRYELISKLLYHFFANENNGGYIPELPDPEKVVSQYRLKHPFKIKNIDEKVKKSIDEQNEDFNSNYFHKEKTELEDKIAELYSKDQEFYKLIENHNPQLLFNLYLEFNKANKRIKEVISDLMGLKLNSKFSTSRESIPVHFNLVLPENFRQIWSKLPDELKQWTLNFNKLKESTDILNSVLNNKEFINSDLHISIDKISIDYTNNLIVILLGQYNPLVIFDSLINDNQSYLFGNYLFEEKHIEIYIAPIILFSIIFGCSTSSFLEITMAHEIVHAYSHLGLDTDKQTWVNEKFRDTEDMIVEGIAQFYTEIYAKRDNNLLDVFMKELAVFGEKYNDFKTWKFNHNNPTEAVRSAMLKARNNKTSYEVFKAEISNFGIRTKEQ